MAIYHFSAQVMSRSKGQSAVAAAAYRSGERLHDERTGENKHYARKVKPETMILSPEHAPDWVCDRNRLWNEVEQMEKRKNSQLAREINVALPRELSHEQQTELIRQFVQTEFVDKGMVADLAIHRDDQENPHAHVMLTTREISEEGFTTKNRSWNDRDLLHQWREEWANHANKALERVGIPEQISHLSHKERGLEQLPTIHLGHVAHEMEKKGVETDRGNMNRERQQYNAIVVDLQKYRKTKELIEQQIAQKPLQQKTVDHYSASERVALQKASSFLQEKASLSTIQHRFEQLERWESKVQQNNEYIRSREKTIQQTTEKYDAIRLFISQKKENQQKIEEINWFNLFKLKQNVTTKKEAEQRINELNRKIISCDKELKQYKQKLEFKTQKDFHSIKEQHKKDYPLFLEKNREARGQIHEERKVLSEAKKTLEKAFVREVASLYPKNPEMRHMSLSTAKNIHELNKANQTVVSVSDIKGALLAKSVRKENVEHTLSNLDQHNQVGKSIFERSLQSEGQSIMLLVSIIHGLEEASKNMQREQRSLERQQSKRIHRDTGLER